MKIFFLPQKNFIYKIFTRFVISCFLIVIVLINRLISQSINEYQNQIVVSSFHNLNLQLFSQEPIFVNFPNPFKYLTYIYVRLPQINNCNIKIYDLFGNVVRTFELTGKQEYIIVWDGKNDLQQKVAKGTYICVLSYENLKLIRKIGCIR